MLGALLATIGGSGAMGVACVIPQKANDIMLEVKIEQVIRLIAFRREREPSQTNNARMVQFRDPNGLPLSVWPRPCSGGWGLRWDGPGPGATFRGPPNRATKRLLRRST